MAARRRVHGPELPDRDWRAFPARERVAGPAVSRTRAVSTVLRTTLQSQEWGPLWTHTLPHIPAPPPAAADMLADVLRSVCGRRSPRADVWKLCHLKSWPRSLAAFACVGLARGLPPFQMRHLEPRRSAADRALMTVVIRLWAAVRARLRAPPLWTSKRVSWISTSTWRATSAS